MFLAPLVFLGDLCPFYLLSNVFCLSLSSKFNSVIIKFDGCNANNLFVPSLFVSSTPLTKTFVFFKLIVSIFPSCFLNWPCMIFTLSPFLSPMLLLPYFFLRSFERCDWTNFFLMCSGALNLYFLCFLGFLLLFHALEKFFILIT